MTIKHYQLDMVACMLGSVLQALVKAHGRALSMGTHLSVRLQQVQSAEAVLRLTPQVGLPAHIPIRCEPA